MSQCDKSMKIRGGVDHEDSQGTNKMHWGQPGVTVIGLIPNIGVKKAKHFIAKSYMEIEKHIFLTCLE